MAGWSPTLPYPHLEFLNPNLGPGGCATDGPTGLYSTGEGGDACFEYGMIAHITGDQNRENDPWEQMMDAIMTGNYTQEIDYSVQPIPITANWAMNRKRRPGEAFLDVEDPRYHITPSKKQRRRRSSKKSSSPKGQDNQAVVAKAATEVSETTVDTTSSSDATGDDIDDCASISSSDACMMRALNGETFEGEYEDYEVSETSSSGTSSDEVGSAENVEVNASKDVSSQNEASGTSSPFDTLRSTPATNMVGDYMSSLSPPDETVNLTRSYAVPVGPSKKKPVMKFTPTSQVNGVDMASFINKLAQNGPASGENIEIDDDAASPDGQYIEMDLALGVLEEKNQDEDLALRSDSSDDSSEDGEETEDVDAITRLTNLKAKGKDVKGKKVVIEEL